MKRFFGYIPVLLLCFVILTGRAQITAPDDMAVSAALLTGPASGFVQIPDGGNPGSTSLRAPTLRQLGIRHTNVYDFALELSWEKFGFYGGYQVIRPSGSATLTKNLITNWVTIPAGSHIRGKVQFDWMRVGAKYKFYLMQRRIILAPELEGDVLFFVYRIPGFINPRHFNGQFVRVGVYGEFRVSKQFSVDSTLATSVPLFNTNLFTADARLKYIPFTSKHCVPILFVGGGYMFINFEDQQKVPNHMQYKQPFFLAGLTIHLR